MFWKIMEDGPGDPGVPAALAGTAYIVWYLLQSARIARYGLVDKWEPDLVEVTLTIRLYII